MSLDELKIVTQSVPIRPFLAPRWVVRTRWPERHGRSILPGSNQSRPARLEDAPRDPATPRVADSETVSATRGRQIIRRLWGAKKASKKAALQPPPRRVAPRRSPGRG